MINRNRNTNRKKNGDVDKSENKRQKDSTKSSFIYNHPKGK